MTKAGDWRAPCDVSVCLRVPRGGDSVCFEDTGCFRPTEGGPVLGLGGGDKEDPDDPPGKVARTAEARWRAIEKDHLCLSFEKTRAFPSLVRSGQQTAYNLFRPSNEAGHRRAFDSVDLDVVRCRQTHHLCPAPRASGGGWAMNCVRIAHSTAFAVAVLARWGATCASRCIDALNSGASFWAGNKNCSRLACTLTKTSSLPKS